MATDCGAPTPIQPQFLTLNNPATANAAALTGGPVVVPPGVLQAVTFDPNAPTAPPLSFSTGNTPTQGTSPNSFGRDIGVNQTQSQNQQGNNQGNSEDENQQGNNQNQQGNNNQQ